MNDTPYRYGHGGPIDAPLLTQEEDALYLALRDGTPFTPARPGHPKSLAGTLTTLAERFACDAQVARLGDQVECRAGYGDRRDGPAHVVAVCVTIYWDDDLAHINSAAAARLADRLDSGVPALEAIRRTLDTCETSTYTEHHLRALEQNADAWVRRLDGIDRNHEHDLGSEAHKEAIRQADRELGTP